MIPTLYNGMSTQQRSERMEMTAGEFYVQRCGKRVGPLIAQLHSKSWPWFIEGEGSFDAQGRFNGRVFDNPKDLLAIASKAPTSTMSDSVRVLGRGEELEKIRADRYSDAMDSAVTAYCSAGYFQRTEGRDRGDGEAIVREKLAFAISAYLREYPESGLVRLARPPAPCRDGTTVGPQAAAQHYEFRKREGKAPPAPAADVTDEMVERACEAFADAEAVDGKTFPWRKCSADLKSDYSRYIRRALEAAALPRAADVREAGLVELAVEALQVINAAFGEYVCCHKAKLTEAEIKEYEANFAVRARKWIGEFDRVVNDVPRAKSALASRPAITGG